MADPSAAAVRPRAVLVACCLGMLTLGIIGNTPALCATAFAREFGLNDAARGFFLSCMFWGLVVSILFSGPLADRFGFRVLLVAAAAFEAAGMALTARAATAWPAYAGAAVVGLGMGMFDALVTPLACAVYPNARARVANLLHSFYPLGMFIVVLAVMALTRAQWSWRAIYLLMGALVLPVGVLFLLVRLPRHSHQGAVRMPTRRLLAGAPYLLLLAAILLAGTTELGFSQWLPSYLERAAGGSALLGAAALLVFGAAMTAGRLANSALAHRLPPRALYIVGAAVCIAALLGAAAPLPPVFILGCTAVFALGVSGLWPTTLGLAGNRFPQAGASMYSLLHVAGNMGGLIGPIVIGVIAEGWRLSAAVAVLAAAPALAIVVLVLYGRKTTPNPVDNAGAAGLD